MHGGIAVEIIRISLTFVGAMTIFSAWYRGRDRLTLGVLCSSVAGAVCIVNGIILVAL